MSLQGDFRALREDIEALEGLIRDLQDERNRAVAALRKYGRHQAPCPRWATSGDAGLYGEQHPCYCGLAALLGEGTDV